MAISTIGNVGADLARVQDKQNRQDSERVATPDAAPADAAAANPAAQVDADTARKLTEAENRRAAESTLTDADVDAAPTPQEHVQAQTREALAAQTNKLSGSLLQLLNE